MDLSTSNTAVKKGIRYGEEYQAKRTGPECEASLSFDVAA